MKQQTETLVQFGKLYDTDEAAALLGVRGGAEYLRKCCQRGEVFQPGHEAVKVGKYWQFDVYRIRQRWAKEQAQPRKV